VGIVFCIAFPANEVFADAMQDVYAQNLIFIHTHDSSHVLMYLFEQKMSRKIMTVSVAIFKSAELVGNGYNESSSK